MPGQSSHQQSSLLLNMVAGLLIIAAGLLLSGTATLAFTIHPEADHGTALYAGDDLDAANRWSLTSGSLVDNGSRGLGGGIEYSFSPSFCEEISAYFAAVPRPACEEIRNAVRRAFDRWSEGKASLQFVDVSDRIDPVLGPEGAEIDVFALRPAEYPQLMKFGAITSWWWNEDPPFGTNGRRLPGHSLTGADIVFSRGDLVCYYMALRFPIGQCNHFESLALHEIGHALGLYHPSEMPYRNFDNDSNPVNKIAIECDDPAYGLIISEKIDPDAVMNVTENRGTPVYIELMPDDLGGRDFLYPTCNLSSLAVVPWDIQFSDLRFGLELVSLMLALALIYKRTCRAIKGRKMAGGSTQDAIDVTVRSGAGNGI